MEFIVFDCIVVGLGGHGSAAIAHISSRLNTAGKVLGIEKFQRAHSNGSSHGRSRIIRQAYFEDPRYVPLLKRAFQLWRNLAAFESASNHLLKISAGAESLLKMTGGLMIGLPDSEVIQGTLASVQQHNLPHRTLTADDIHTRYPAFCPSSEEIGVFEDEAGYLIPEACVNAHLEMASECGAELHFEESVITWEILSDHLVKVSCDTGVIYYAKQLVLTVGPWAVDLYGKDIAGTVPLHVERRVLYWFDVKDEEYTEYCENMPIYIWEYEEGNNFYGFPKQPGPPGGVKVAMHYIDESSGRSYCTPETIDREVHESEVHAMRQVLSQRMPQLSGSLVSTATCMYTCTPDKHFLVDRHPAHKEVILASPCSGHGFKFCSVIGEIIADLVLLGDTDHDISLFRLAARAVA